MLIKKALLSAGYEDIPVISIAFDDAMQNQQEFILDYKPFVKTAIYAALFADSISKIYYSAVAREKQKGQALTLRDKYISEVQNLVKQNNSKAILKLLHGATVEFNSIIDLTKTPPRIGIVGEIYVKYNSIGHKNVVNWLVSQGVEVVMPPILSFFIQYFVNRRVNIRENLTPKKIFDDIYPFLVQKYLGGVIRKVERVAANYLLWQPFGDIEEEALEAEKIITLATQFGEGWLIPAEISNFNKHGIQNVVSLQPFGCIANHIISKGIEKRIKNFYPRMNLLFLDFDSGVSDVNVHNRLHFMIRNATVHGG
jgi:predicted nucleotide-binding protein (sugar kinase/HSP70/actin superfamily)